MAKREHNAEQIELAASEAPDSSARLKVAPGEVNVTKPDPAQAPQDAVRTGPQEMADMVADVTRAENPIEELTAQLRGLQNQPHTR